MKRFFILLTALMLAAASCARAETIIPHGESPDFVQALLTVAEGELGYVEGGNNYSKYGVWSGDPNAAWCAEFICWCVDQLDQQQGTQLLTTVYPKYSGQNTGRDWFIKRGRFVYRKAVCPDWGYQWMKGSDRYLSKNEYIPRPCDLMFFSYNEAGDTEHVALVEQGNAQTVVDYRARLEAKLQEVLANTSIDESRILTEAAIFADKVAVDEETVRLRSHLEQMNTMLTTGGAVGRKLDFLLQEMNREANTIGSKCTDVKLAKIVVDIKAELEKIREQTQNIE